MALKKVKVRRVKGYETYTFTSSPYFYLNNFYDSFIIFELGTLCKTTQKKFRVDGANIIMGANLKY